MDAVRLKLSPKPLKSDIKQRIEYLDSKGRIVGLKNEYGRKFEIADEGLTWLKRNG